MKGFVVGCGRSGTKWAATALVEVCGLDARHESMGHVIYGDYDGVESNGNFWSRVPYLMATYRDAAVVHLVRDGRLVVRSTLSRNPPLNLHGACRRWTNRNERIARDVDPDRRFRLEDLVSDFAAFRRFAAVFGVERPIRKKWESIRGKRINATRHRTPPFDSWDAAERNTFWRICGPTMARMGYDR